MRQIHNFNGTLVEKNMFYFNSSIYYAALHAPRVPEIDEHCFTFILICYRGQYLL